MSLGDELDGWTCRNGRMSRTRHKSPVKGVRQIEWGQHMEIMDRNPNGKELEHTRAKGGRELLPMFLEWTSREFQRRIRSGSVGLSQLTFFFNRLR
ncbi:uncharacterized protein N7479_011192 [Penicillium vulpinum]|uniref:uncharacterized protein n=1 Tax=Penicillium vulpinum TaxID=29845 RepID=UPI0025486471|nr:uncharacterized protein N7479_011192 [Penicillium vulpinum]KAJ5952779.1 hypothetical protein N7479_011192 [Penicillium vulpinum]